MRRRGFFGAMGVLGAALTLGTGKRKPKIRFVEFASPRESPAIYWLEGHEFERFAWLWSGAWGTLSIPQEQIRLGYATRKLSLSGMYFSDTPQEGFEPITYWIRADHFEQEVTA